MNLLGTNIMLDRFVYKKNDLIEYVYFLSHFHTDHLVGLNQTWKYGRIYTSSITKNLLINKYPQLKGDVIALEMNTEHWVYLDKAKSEGMSVWLFDANHIIGSVMFLMKGKIGNILYTGDFRFTERMYQNKILYPKITEEGNPKAIDIDHLVLDNTFCDEQFKFPPKHEAFKQMVNIIKEHKDHKIIILIYKTGKEEILIKLSNIFNTKIGVTQEKYKLNIVMGLGDENFTTNIQSAWIIAQSMNECGIKRLVEANVHEPTIFILPTGQQHLHKGQHPKYFKVPFSSHCNYLELETFVKSIMPRKISFIVPYEKNGNQLMNGPSYFLKNYVRKPNPNEETRELEKVGFGANKSAFEERKMDSKEGNKRLFHQAFPQLAKFRNKKAKGAEFNNKEVILSLSLSQGEEAPREWMKEQGAPLAGETISNCIQHSLSD